MESKILRSIPLLIFGSWFTFKLHRSSGQDFFVDGFVFLAIGLAGLVFFVRTIFRDRKEFKLTRDITEYIPTFTGVCFTVLIFSIFFHQYRRANAPTLLHVFYDGGFNGVSIDFKVDGNYILTNGSGLGQSYFYGTYLLVDSVITIDRQSIDGVVKSNTFVIRTSPYYRPLQAATDSKPNRANYVTQVDADGKELDENFRFRVIKDNRE